MFLSETPASASWNGTRSRVHTAQMQRLTGAGGVSHIAVSCRETTTRQTELAAVTQRHDKWEN